MYRDFEKLFQSHTACEWAELEHELTVQYGTHSA